MKRSFKDERSPGDAAQKSEVLCRYRTLYRKITALWFQARPHTRPAIHCDANYRSVTVDGTARNMKRYAANDDTGDEEDYDFPVWSGVLPVLFHRGPSQKDERNLSDVAVRQHLQIFASD